MGELSVMLPTRREILKGGGALVGGGLLAGCTGGSGSGDGANNSTNSGGGANGSDGSSGDGNATSGGGGRNSYSVSMSPMGEVMFEQIPKAVYTGLPNTADMVIAADHGDAINAIYHPEYHGTLMNNFYERLDGVSFEWKGLTNSWNLGKEGFYELGSDVHFTDPVYASTLDNLDRKDIEEIRKQIGPWFGNYYSGSHGNPSVSWVNNYQYYTLWEIFSKVAQVLQVGTRAEKLANVHKSLLSMIQTNLPPEDERPTAALVFKGKGESFWVYHLNSPGFLTAHTRPLGATDVFAGFKFEGAQTQVDYEAMLDADPNNILVLFTMSPSYSITDIRDKLKSNAVAQEISAVKNGRVYAQGARYQGPILNLFQLEMTAKQLYPDQFGEWPGYDGGPYPKIPEDEQLFDRQRVADIINGKL